MAVAPLTLQADPDAFRTLSAALSAAAVYSIFWYLRSYAKDGESFHARKFLATLIVGLTVAFVSYRSGITLTQEGFAARMTVYVGVISLVEALLKAAYAEWFRVTGGRGGLDNADWGRP